jgi:hypothetical protein
MNAGRSETPRGEARGVFSNRVREILRGIALWLDVRSARSYPQDTHSWPAKTETLRALKTGVSQPAAAQGWRVPALQ